MKNTIKINAYIQKRDKSEFTDEQQKELSERIESVIRTLGYEFVQPVKEAGIGNAEGS